jgi:hypothetical protein
MIMNRTGKRKKKLCYLYGCKERAAIDLGVIQEESEVYVYFCLPHWIEYVNDYLAQITKEAEERMGDTK